MRGLILLMLLPLCKINAQTPQARPKSFVNKTVCACATMVKKSLVIGKYFLDQHGSKILLLYALPTLIFVIQKNKKRRHAHSENRTNLETTAPQELCPEPQVLALRELATRVQALEQAIDLLPIQPMITLDRTETPEDLVQAQAIEKEFAEKLLLEQRFLELLENSTDLYARTLEGKSKIFQETLLQSSSNSLAQQTEQATRKTREIQEALRVIKLSSARANIAIGNLERTLIELNKLLAKPTTQAPISRQQKTLTTKLEENADRMSSQVKSLGLLLLEITRLINHSGQPQLDRAGHLPEQSLPNSGGISSFSRIAESTTGPAQIFSHAAS